MYHRSHQKEESARSSSLDLGVFAASQQPHSHRVQQSRHSIPNAGEIQWFLFQHSGTISFRLSTQYPIVIGSEKCDITIKSPTVEKLHSVLSFEPNSNCFLVRDLNTTNGTYLNNRRISADHPETLSNLDLLRFGYGCVKCVHPTLYEVRSASLTTAGIGSGNRGSSSLPQSPYKTGKDGVQQRERASSSLSYHDNNIKHLPRSSIGVVNPLPKSLLTVTKSDPGIQKLSTREVINERLEQQRRTSNNFSGFQTTIGGGSPVSSSPAFVDKSERHSLSFLQSQPPNVMHQGGRHVSIVNNGTSSPSLTLDSGRGSSSAPSSPSKEIMSPVQMSGGNTTGGGGGMGVPNSTPSSSTSPVFARKLSRPMEYLLGQQADQQEEPEPAFVPDASYEMSSVDCEKANVVGRGAFLVSPTSSSSLVNNSGPSSGNYGGNYCHEPGSFSSMSYNQNIENNNHFPSGTDCEILQITEEYDGDICVRKDSLEEDEDVDHLNQDVMLLASDGGVLMQPQFLVGGDIMQPDLNVPNEVFGPVSHAEILNKNLAEAANINQICSTGKQGNKPADTYHARARSSSGDGGSNRSTPLSTLYGTPHWWPESPPPEENGCPPPPVPSSNSSPMKKPYLLNNNILLTNAAAARLQANSCNLSYPDNGRDLSLESTHSQKSTHVPCSPLPSPSIEEGTMMEVKKFTPMAFTIDFNDSEPGAGTASSEAAEAKKAAIAERLSKFAPRHRRTASATKSDDVPTKDDSGASELPVSLASSNLSSKQGKSSTNSLGRHQKQSTVGIAAAESSRTTSLPKKLSGGKHPSGGSNSTNNNDSGLRSLSPETISSTTSSSSRSRPLIEPSGTTPKISSSRDNLSSGIGASVTGSVMANKAKTPQPNRSSITAVKRTARAGTVKLSSVESTTSPVQSSYVVAKADRNVTPLNDLSKETPKAVVVTADKEDTVSEAGTYTVEKETPEVENARENIEEIFGLTDVENVNELEKENISTDANKTFCCAEPGTRDWVREWAELAAQQHQQKQRPELPETQYFLRETETLVTAIQERVSKHMKSGGGSAKASLRGASDSEDEPTLSHHSPVKPLSQHSTPTNNKKRPPSRSSPFHRESSVLSDSGYAIGYQSDSSNDGSRDLSHGIGVKMNRVLNIRRCRVGYESDGYASQQLLMMNQQSMTLPLPLNNIRGVSPSAQLNNNKYNNVVSARSATTATSSTVTNTSAPLLSRNDGGRFSLRMPKARTPPAAQMPPPPPKYSQSSNAYHPGSSGEPNGRAMNGNKSDSHSSTQSWNKKSAPSGKVINTSGTHGKKPGNRSNSTLTAKEVEMANWKRRKNYDPMKAAAEGKKNKKNVTSETESGAEEVVPLPPITSPKMNRREAMMTKSLSFHQESYSPKCPSEDEDMIYIVDEMDNSHPNSPNHLGMTRSYHEDVMYYGMPSTPIRPKNKLEALDNLVIATIHSLSNKVRTSSRQLLEKLQVQHSSDENGALLEEMVSQLKELEGPTSNVSPNKSPSRELSGTLKNLKKLEQVILVLDKVLCDEFESDVNG